MHGRLLQRDGEQPHPPACEGGSDRGRGRPDERKGGREGDRMRGKEGEREEKLKFAGWKFSIL